MLELYLSIIPSTTYNLLHIFTPVPNKQLRQRNNLSYKIQALIILYCIKHYHTNNGVFGSKLFTAAFTSKHHKTSIDYFKCVQHTGQSPETHHTPQSQRDWVTTCIPH
jgi:hypothetical protein